MESTTVPFIDLGYRGPDYATIDLVVTEDYNGEHMGIVIVAGFPVMIVHPPHDPDSYEQAWSWLEAEIDPCRTYVRDATVYLLETIGELSTEHANLWRDGGMNDDSFADATQWCDGHPVCMLVDRVQAVLEDLV